MDLTSEQTPSTPSAVVVREATPPDLDAAVELIRLADGHHLEFDNVAHYLHRLDPKATRAWVAFVGERPAGITRVLFRKIYRDGGPHPAAYWMNMFIHPDFRDLMLYPRLVLAMLAGVKKLGYELLYVAVRRPGVAEGHLKLGFQKVDDLTVLAKPVRPGHFLVKYRRVPALIGALARPVDWLYGQYLAVRRPRSPTPFVVEEIPWDSPRLEQVATLWNPPGEIRMRQGWTAACLRQRYTRSVESVPYFLVGVRRGEDLVSAAIFREADRAPGIRLGVIMDAAYAPGQLSALGYALAEAERRLVRIGCEILLYLDGLGDEVSQLMRRLGYVKTFEKYVLMRYPKNKDLHETPYGNRIGWRFAFGDHDAF
jgi:hypothetical protein